MDTTEVLVSGLHVSSINAALISSIYEQRMNYCIAFLFSLRALFGYFVYAHKSYFLMSVQTIHTRKKTERLMLSNIFKLDRVSRHVISHIDGNILREYSVDLPL